MTYRQVINALMRIAMKADGSYSVTTHSNNRMIKEVYTFKIHDARVTVNPDHNIKIVSSRYTARATWPLSCFYNGTTFTVDTDQGRITL